MSRAFIDLLSADRLASRFGGSLSPQLRAAIEAELVFRAKSSGRIITRDETIASENVVDLRTYAPGDSSSNFRIGKN